MLAIIAKPKRLSTLGCEKVDADGLAKADYFFNFAAMLPAFKLANKSNANASGIG